MIKIYANDVPQHAVYRNPIFTEDVKELLNDDEYGEFQQFMADNPEWGDVILNTGGLHEVPWAARGWGKRGSFPYYLLLQGH